ncbi:hypothetical protein HMPREF1990_01725 [Porphyromonas gingivalis W4087]|nr:hypothetical protein HMPREF1990_01725 [Porphyromonas gingivalis W4087]
MEYTSIEEAHHKRPLFGVRKRQCIRSLISGLHTKILGVIGCSVQAIA